MSVDLSDLIESLQREVNPPGSDLFPDATDDDYLGHLADSFWDARLDGLLEGYEEADGIVTPIDVDDDDLTRDLQQLIVLYAGIRIVRNAIRNTDNLFRAKAGATEFESQKTASQQIKVLEELQNRRNIVLTRLSDLGSADTYYIDAVLEREDSINYGSTYYWTS